MAVNVRKIIAAGFERAYYGPIDSAGYLIGSTTTAPAAGAQAGAAMGRLLGVKTSDITLVEPEILTVTGDDQALGTFLFPATENPSFTIEVGVADLDLMALAQGTAVANIGDLSIGALQPDSPDFPNMCLIFMRRAKSKASGSDGAVQWEGIIIPNAQLFPLGSGNFTERQGASYSYRVVAQPASVMPWGQALGSGVGQLNLSTDFANLFPFTAENRITIHRFTGDGVEDEFTLGETPAAANKVYVYVDGALQTITTNYTISDKTITFGGGNIPANNSKIEVIYEFTP